MSTIKANTLLHSDGTTTTQPSIPALAPAMANADYILAGTSYWKYILGHRNDSHDYFTTTSARVAVGVSTTNIGDSGSVSVLVMGGQA